MPTLFVSKRRFLVRFLAVAFTISGSIIVFVLSSAVTAVRAQVKAAPFYLERSVFMDGSSGNLSAVGNEITARRSDGATCSVRLFGPLVPGQYVRELTFADGTHVYAIDAIRVKTTMPPLSEAELEVMRARFTAAPPDCGIHEPNKLLRHDRLGGQSVVVVQYNVANTYRLTLWKAPDLGCEALAQTTEKMKPDGSLALGVKPSVALARLLKHQGIVLSPAVQAEVDQGVLEDDRRYSRRPGAAK